MKNGSSHPARQPEFLSRLHDGELTAAERVQFESHRAHCGECRKAAAQFEEALSLYRRTSTAAPSRDLASRILRKLEAASPRRRSPFGVVFGIDVRWAGLFAAALIAVIIGSSVVADREAARRAAAPTPISVFMQSEKRETRTEAKVAPPDLPASSGRRERSRAPQVPAASGGTAAPIPPGQPAPRIVDKREEQAPLLKAERPAAAPPRAAQQLEAGAPASARMQDRAGGEGTAGLLSPPSDMPAARLAVVAVDRDGTAPPILTPDAAVLLSGERGRQYLLLVEPSGRVLEATRADSKKGFASEPEARQAPPSVLNLRFAAGDRPRRLLLRIE